MVFTQGPSAHLRSLATSDSVGAISVTQSHSLRSGRCRKNLPLCDLPMSVYEAAIVDTEPSAGVIQVVRRLTDLAIPDIPQRVTDALPVIAWNADEHALDGDRDTIHRRILSEIASLRDAGCALAFQYRPAPDDPAEDVTYDQMLNLMQADVDFDNSDHV